MTSSLHNRRFPRLGGILFVSLVVSLVMSMLAISVASAAPVLNLSGCQDNTLFRNDDGSSDLVTLPFQVKFYDKTLDSLYVNNNGNVTFDQPLSTYVPFDLKQTDRTIIAPFFADVDTRPADGGTVTWGNTSYEGKDTFCVVWDVVGYYSQHTDLKNTFQLLLVKNSAAGDFDIIFRYDSIQWELGSASSNVPARAGFSNGLQDRSYELAGSAISGAFLDNGPFALNDGSLNGTTPGVWRFRIRDGQAGNDPRNIPTGYDASSDWWDWPDTDDDGLPDYWEQNGVWVSDHLVDLASYGARVGQIDALVYVDRVEGERWNDNIENMLRASFAAAPLAPDGTTNAGIKLHIIKNNRVLARSEVPAHVDESAVFFGAVVGSGFTQTGLSGTPGSVPALAKYVCACPDYADYPDDGQTRDGRDIGGIAEGIKADRLLLTINERRWINEIQRQTGLSFASADGLVGDRLNAVITMHELGHLYGLRHHGVENEPTLDPTYTSIMSYSYSAFGVPVSSSLLPAIDYSRSLLPINLDWRFGADFGALSLVHGQNGEVGSFYSTIGSDHSIGEPSPPEPPIGDLLADDFTRQIIKDGGQAIIRQAEAEQAVSPQTEQAVSPQTVTSDSVKPTIRIKKVKIGRLLGTKRAHRSATVLIKFLALDDKSSPAQLIVTCRLDQGKPKPCRGSVVFKHVKPGKHKLIITAVDAENNLTKVSRALTVGKAKKGR